MSRIKLNDDMISVVTKMSDGNPGAITALTELMNKTPEVDPEAMMGPLAHIMSLDTWEIYGSDIYILWSDKCGRDTRKLIMLLRAVQLGFLSQAKLQEMAADQMRRVDISPAEMQELDDKVCDTLNHFIGNPAKENV